MRHFVFLEISINKLKENHSPAHCIIINEKTQVIIAYSTKDAAGEEVEGNLLINSAA